MEEFPDATVIVLRGPLGSGKTHFAKGIGEALGIAPEQIKSPSFLTLMEHEGRRPLLHLDFYRHEKPQDLSRDFWEELLERENAVIVAEWPERVEGFLPLSRLEVLMEIREDESRKIRITHMTP